MRALLALLALLCSTPAWAQTAFDPKPVALVCAYNSSGAPTPIAGQYYLVQCDANGKLITSGSSSGGGGATVTITSSAPTSSVYTLTGTASFNGTILSNAIVAIYKDGIYQTAVTTNSSGNFSYTASGVFNADVFTAQVVTLAQNSSTAASLSVPSQDVLISQNDYTQGALASGDSITRSGTIAAYYASSGYLQTPGAGANTARFDYNPATLAANGLLVEIADTNNSNYSNAFTNAYWTTTNTSVTASATTSPDGTTDAFSVVVPGSPTSSSKAVYWTTAQNITAGVGSVSVYAKANGYNYVNLGCNVGASNYAVATFDVSLGNATSGTMTQKAFSGTLILGGLPQIQYVGNGWYHVYLLTNLTSGTTTGQCQFALSDTGTPTIGGFGNYTFTGTATKGIYAYGFQQTSTATPISSYMPTTSGTASRSADTFANTAWGSDSVIAEWLDEQTNTFYRQAYINTAVATNGTTASGTATLHFASTPSTVLPGMAIVDATSGTVIPGGTTVLSITGGGTVVTMSANATGAGVGSGDSIVFSFTPLSNVWYRRICLYPTAMDAGYAANQLTVGAACY